MSDWILEVGTATSSHQMRCSSAAEAMSAAWYMNRPVRVLDPRGKVVYDEHRIKQMTKELELGNDEEYSTEAGS